MKISLIKVPVNADKESTQKLCVEISDDKAILSLPLSSEVTQEQYERALRDFYNACDNITEVSTAAK